MTDAPTTGWYHKWGESGKYSSAAEHHKVYLFADDRVCGSLAFQDGPVQEQGFNGTTNEQVIEVLIERLTALNQPPHHSEYNERALGYLRSALAELQARTLSRSERGVEGTSTP